MKRKKNNFYIYRKNIILFLLIAIVSTCTSACSFLGLPQANRIDELHLVEATQVFDSSGQLISKLFEENRIVVSINSMSPYVQQAIIANEDVRFYEHIGIDPIGILRAIWVNLRAGSLTEGGSTITQQLAKNMFLTQERTLTRKIKEALLAFVIETKFSKQEILQAYLNQVYFGEGAYGIESAAQLYYSKHANELSLGEGALLAGIPRGPNVYSPFVDSNAALARRADVLNGMVKAGYITQTQAQEAQNEPLKLAGKKKRTVQASYFLDHVASELVSRYGANRVYKGGLKVYTTLDIKAQQAAESVLGQRQGAVLTLDPRTGYIKAMVGGRDYQESQINRVIAEIRQPGSAFKPFLYAAALTQGLAANSMILDQPININGYVPQNYDKKYHGLVTLKKALRQSINIPAVKLAQKVGPKNVINLAQKLGISTLVAEDENLAIALGGLTQGVNLLELTTAYTAFANNGVLSQPISIMKVIGENGQVLEESHLSQQSVLDADISYLVTDILKDAITSGTGSGANIGRAAAGKTGTTDNYETAWFIGYTPELLTGIFIGNDDRKSVGISGSEVAAMWGRMMNKALSDSPVSNFQVPPNIVTNIAICADSGKLATPLCREVEHSAFIRGTEPTRILPPPEEKPSEPQPEKKNSGFPWKLFLPRLPGF